MAARVKFAFTPYPLQQQVIDHLDGKAYNSVGEPYRFFVVAIGRQAGKSWLAKYTLMDRAINRDQNCVWVAPSIPTARGHWDDLVKLIGDAGVPIKKISQAAKQIVFFNGGQISVRSAVEPDNMRGITADFIVMDEAAFFRNGEYVWYSIVLPMVTASRGVVLFTSTPNGRNWFWSLYKQGNDPHNQLYKSWQAPSTISPYQDPDLLDQLRQSMPEYQWREEFLAEFLSDSGGVFSGSEAAATITALMSKLSGHSYVAGVDFGFNNDATTITIVDKWTSEQVYGKRFYNYGTAGTMRQIVDLLRSWQPDVTYVEKNGIGESLFEILKAALGGENIPESIMPEGVSEEDELSVVTGDYRPESSYTTEWHGKIKAVHMDNKLKRKMVEGLAAAIEYGRLKTLAPEPGTYGEIQLNEMSTYQRERTQSGLDITYNATEGNHDDTISALYLAFYAMPRNRSIQQRLDSGKKISNPFKTNLGRKHLSRGIR